MMDVMDHIHVGRRVQVKVNECSWSGGLSDRFLGGVRDERETKGKNVPRARRQGGVQVGKV